MATVVDRVRARVVQDQYAQALDLLAPTWGERPSIAIAGAIDALDARLGGPAFTGPTAAWVKAAKASTPATRGPLIRGIANRTSADTLKLLKLARGWRDPRLTHALADLLEALPWAGVRSRDVWRDIFELVARHGDPRFAAIAQALPATWKVGGPMQTWLTNQLASATEELAPVADTPDDAALVALAVELRRATPEPIAMPATAEALLAAIYANPDDDEPRLVYADWLQERGDVRGEFIALHLRGDPSMIKRERELLKANKKAWLGALANVLRGEVEFRRGFPASGTATFRHQRDVEQWGSLVEWATIEEIEFGHQIIRIDQRQWAKYVGPAMRSLRVLRRPDVTHVLAATAPWQIHTLELDTRGLEPEHVAELARSPLLPKLDRLELYGWRDAAWIAKLSASPPHLALSGNLERDELRDLLAAAKRGKLESLTIRQYGGAVHRFTRDTTGAFTRLDIEVRPPTRAKTLAAMPNPLPMLVTAIQALPKRSLTHFDAKVEIGGTMIPATPLIDAAAPKLY